VTAQAILEAMDGIALLIDRDLRIAGRGWRHWERFWRDNGGPAPVPDPTGSCILDYFLPGETREEYQRLLQEVLSGARPVVRVEFRCDGPAIRRHMRLSMTPVELPAEMAGAAGDDAATRRGVLYQSVPLEVTQRPRLPLFGAGATGEAAAAEQGRIVTMCSVCARVGWPPDAPAAQAEWVEPAEYYRRGGAEQVLVAHGFCPACRETVLSGEL